MEQKNFDFSSCCHVVWDAVKAASSSTAEVQALPRWDLSALYTGMDDPALTEDKLEAERLVQAFAHDYQGKVADLTASELAKALDQFEVILFPATLIEKQIRICGGDGSLRGGRRKVGGTGSLHGCQRKVI